MKIEVITFQDWRKLNLPAKEVVVTVSKAEDWSRGLSPFVLGPCKLYDGYVSKNMENAWQFSKVYAKHIKGGQITDDYWEWAKEGWSDNRAHRYPMGKGAIPEFSYWNGKRLGYVEARKHIYIPLYYKAVKDTGAFKILKEKYKEAQLLNHNLYLVDFDAYRHQELNMTYRDVINCEDRKMGHAFVLAMMLEEPEKLKKAVDRISL
jgi:hypothetical protein